MQFTDASDLLTSTAGPPTSHLGPGGSFKNLPILAKLLIAFGMVLAVCTVISVFSLLQLHAIKQDLEKVTDGAALLQQRSHLIAGVSAAFWILIASLGAGAIGVMLSSLFIKIAVVRPIEAAGMKPFALHKGI